MAFRFTALTILGSGLLSLAAMQPARAATYTLDFEDLPDSVAVANFYAPKGIHFLNTVSLTAGFSLNEFDYPPSSGMVAVGDDGVGPLRFWFDSPTTDLSANFTHGSPLTITAFSDPLFTTPFAWQMLVAPSNLGSTIRTDFHFGAARGIQIETTTPMTMIMDDLTYTTRNGAIPEPATAGLAIIGLLSVAAARYGRRLRGRGATVLALAVLALLAVPAYADRGVFQPQVNPSETMINTPTAVTITAEVGTDGSTPLLPGSVLLYETTADGAPLAQIGLMYDDGTHGDAVAADTIFTMQMTVNETTPRTRWFRVSVAYTGVRNRYLSPVFSVAVYPPLPNGLIDLVIQATEQLNSDFLAALAGGKSLADARNIALQNALNNPRIGPGNASLNGPDLSIMYVFPDPNTGFTYQIPGWVPLADPNNPSDSAGRSTPSNLPANFKSPGNDKLLLWGPGYNEPDAQNGIMDHAAAQFNSPEYMTFDPNPPVITGGSNASLEVVKHWGDYGTVIIHTHGGYWALGGNNYVVLLSGTPSSFWSQLSYMFDLLAKRIAVSGKKFVFYPSFITKHVSSMKNTFIYLGACESLKNDTMWNALAAKGAKVGFGWSETVSRAFNTATFARLIDPMVPATNASNPLSALDAFNAVSPKVDPWGGHNATFLMRTASADWNSFFFTDGGLVNGDFETGDFSGWQHGGALSDGHNYQLVVGSRKHAGSWAAAIGRWDTAYSGYNPALEPSGYEWIYQDFTVPSNVTKLSFWWWQETYDTAVWDWFDAQIRTTAGAVLANIVTHGGKPGTNYGPYWTTGAWQYAEVNISAWRGQKIRIYFDQRLDGYGDQTRTYIDDVKLQ